MDSHNPQEFLGVDVGGSRIGIARGSSRARIAEPLKTVDAKHAISLLQSIAKDNHAQGLVIGLPRGLDGQETPQTTAVRAWTAKAKSQIGLPFYWQDEALTSHQAKQGQSISNQADIDAGAAAIILQDFLDTPDDQRVLA